MKAEPQKEHQWLQKLVGEWTYEHEAPTGPDKPPEKFTGTDSVRSLGGFWVVCEGRTEVPGGGSSTMIMSLGYDPAKKKYVGSFIGSMMAELWIYDNGELSADGKVLTLDSDGPSFTTPGKMAKYKDSIEFVDDDHRILRSRVQDDDGNWQEFMAAHYHRKK